MGHCEPRRSAYNLFEIYRTSIAQLSFAKFSFAIALEIIQTYAVNLWAIVSRGGQPTSIFLSNDMTRTSCYIYNSTLNKIWGGSIGDLSMTRAALLGNVLHVNHTEDENTHARNHK